jgi:hypothetical protein
VWSTSIRLRWFCRPLCPEAYRAGIGASLVGMAPPQVIFAPGRQSAVLMRLQTADHSGGASPVKEEEDAPTAGDRARIMRFAMREQEDAVPLLRAHDWQRIFSPLLEASHHCIPSLG